MANLIEKYRATQRRIRRILDPHTARLCPVCPEPCCRKPTKVREFDVLLARACGFDLPSADVNVIEYVETGVEILRSSAEGTDCRPCDYLGEKGCVFPDDLRPFECTRWMCSFLKNEMSPGEMREIRDLLHRLGVLHRALVDSTVRRK